MKIFGGKYKGTLLKSPKDIRPTKGVVREAVFNICQQKIVDAIFLDLFAGSGSMGFEALSRGARLVVFVEQSVDALRCIRANLAALEPGATSAYIFPMNALSAISLLQKQKYRFDLIYIDPPYDQIPNLANALIQKIEETKLLNEEGLLFLETGKEPISLSLSSLALIRERRFGTSRLYQLAL
jgi:16S rRNA (guanine966-N2)-methyltransferase